MPCSAVHDPTPRGRNSTRGADSVDNGPMTSLILPSDQVEPVARALVGAIAADDGPTDEQLGVLRALLVHLWQRPDLVAEELEPFDPAAAAEAVAGTASASAAMRAVKRAEWFMAASTLWGSTRCAHPGLEMSHPLAPDCI